MAKARLAGSRLYFRCPGCQCVHRVPIEDCGPGVPVWEWNRSVDAPTLFPSINYSYDNPETQCHSFVKDGKIQFMSDCWHSLKGQTVTIPDWE